MQGEAILGLEAAARALVREGTSCLNLVSGIFGKGFGYWLTALGADLHEIEECPTTRPSQPSLSRST